MINAFDLSASPVGVFIIYYFCTSPRLFQLKLKSTSKSQFQGKPYFFLHIELFTITSSRKNMFVTWNQLKPIISGSLWKKMMISFSFDYENERASLIICRTSTLIDKGFQRVWHLLWANFIGNHIKMNVLHQEKCLKPENRLTQYSLDHFIWWCLRFRGSFYWQTYQLTSSCFPYQYSYKL